MQLTNCINDQTTYQAQQQQQQQRFKCATWNPPNYGYSQPSAAVGLTVPQHGIQEGDTQTIIALIQQLRDAFSKRLNCIENKISKKLMKGKALRKHSLHEKTAASVLLKLFISGNEWCHTTDAP